MLGCAKRNVHVLGVHNHSLAQPSHESPRSAARLRVGPGLQSIGSNKHTISLLSQSTLKLNGS
jgi:hypothetical protein